MIFLLLSICCTIEHIAIFKVPGYSMKKKFYCRARQGTVIVGAKAKHYNSLLEVSAACTRDSDCKGFLDKEGKGKTFTICSPTAEVVNTAGTTILYSKRKVANFQTNF